MPYNEARVTSNFLPHPPHTLTRGTQLKIPAMKFDRGKYGDSGGGGGGEKSGSGKGNSSSGDGLEISDAGGLPEGNHKTITDAEGGAISIEVGSGHPNKESSDDGGTRNQAYGAG